MKEQLKTSNFEPQTIYANQSFGSDVMDERSAPYNMKRIRVLTIIFDSPIASHEIPAFRGAIARKVGLEHDLFHNHQGESFRYRYPLIQYKRLGGKAAIICIEEGVDEIHRFFINRNWNLNISGRDLEVKVEKLDLNSFNMQVWDKTFTYRLQNWIGINQRSFDAYKELHDEDSKMRFLEKKLIGNILSFAKGIDWHIDKKIELAIDKIERKQLVKIKGIPVSAYSLIFRTNVFLPIGIGLGKSPSLGYGVVQKYKAPSPNSIDPEK